MGTTVYTDSTVMSPAEMDWETRKSKLVLYALVGKFAFMAIFVGMIIWGQDLSTASKLNLIFGSGLIIMTSMLVALFRIYTREEVRRNIWVALVMGFSIAICIWALYSVQVSPPSL